MSKIAFATGSRADYGIVRRYLSLLNKDETIDLSILATGSLLSNEYGHQIDLIREDGYKIDVEIDAELDSRSNEGVIHSMSVVEDGFGSFFENNKYDLLIILGDRYEMLSVATAAAINRIPILHLHGGEATYGNYDEFIRHAITKMSLYHFTATNQYRKRVIQLGEDPNRVFYLGALGAENCMFIEEEKVPDMVKKLEPRTYFVVLFHPETLTNISATEQISEILNALENYPDYKFVFLGSNADTHSNEIRDRVRAFVDSNSNAMYFENLPTAGYHFLLKQSLGLIGNSSSGLIEAPSLGICTVNIGDRQKGRDRGNSVFDVECKTEEIIKGINNVLRESDIDIFNPYYKKNTANNYYDATKKIIELIKKDTMFPKQFYDLQE